MYDNGHILVITVFEIIFCGASLVFPLFLLIISLIIHKDLQISNYFRFQFMIAILIESILRFFDNYPYTNIIAYLKSIIELIILLFITSFTLLSYLTVKRKAIYASQKRIFIIALSLISWLFPCIYVGVFWLINVFKKKEDVIFVREENHLVFGMQYKIIIDFGLVGFLFIMDFFLFSFMLIKLFKNSKKKNDMNESNLTDKDSHCLRVTMTFIIQILFFCVNILDNIDLYLKKNKVEWSNWKYKSNLLYLISLAFVSGLYAIESRVLNFFKEKVLKCIDLRNNREGRKNEEGADIRGGNEEEEEEFDEDDEEQGDIYVENRDRFSGGLIPSLRSSRNSAFNQ